MGRKKIKRKASGVCACCGRRVLGKLLKPTPGITLHGKPVLACAPCLELPDSEHEKIFSREFRQLYGVELAEVWGV